MNDEEVSYMQKDAYVNIHHNCEEILHITIILWMKKEKIGSL